MVIDSFRGKYSFLSNFYETPVMYDGIIYQSSEVAFQACKVLDAKERFEFTRLNSSDAKKLGRKVKCRSDWDNIKTSIMKDICFAKFSQNPNLKQKLLETKDAILIEGNTWGDMTWGQVNGVGENRLGKILMEVREALK